MLLEKAVGRKQQTFSWCPASVAALRARCVGAALANRGWGGRRKNFRSSAPPNHEQRDHVRTARASSAKLTSCFAHIRRSEDVGVDMPFLFHCGETLEMGTGTDGNLVDALLLNSKRIGHGYALVRHPHIMEQMKERGICLEVCIISNQILGLLSRTPEHSIYALLANNVHRTISSDNGTLFR